MSRLATLVCCNNSIGKQVIGADFAAIEKEVAMLQACDGGGQSRGGPGVWFAGVTVREILPVCCGPCPSRFMAIPALPVASNRPLQVSAVSFSHENEHFLSKARSKGL